MQFWTLNIVLAALVFTFDHIRSASADDYPIADKTDEAVDDSDQGINNDDHGFDDADQEVDDDDQGFDDDDQGVDEADGGDNDEIVEPDDVAVEGKDCPDPVHDDEVNSVEDDKGINFKPKKEKFKLDDKMNEVVAAQCKKGQYFYYDGCNICYCYGEGTQGCTDILCGKQSKTKLVGNPKQALAYKKLRDTATGCVPGEKIKSSNGCDCHCVLPSVMTCDKACISYS